jgi:hypothetical protein
VAREAAVARLVIIGPRAVGQLVTALGEARQPAHLVAILQALERIGDGRALTPASRMLTHRDLPVALAAVAAVRPQLQSPHAAVADDAVRALTDLVLDTSRADSVRAAGLDALHDLPVDAVEPILVRLRDDPSPRLRRQAGWAAVETGPDQLEAQADALSGEDPEELRAAVETGGASVPLPLLHRLVVRARQREQAEQSPDVRSRWRVARAAVHQVLADRGSRVALYDLRETFESARETMPLGMVAAVAQIGDGSCLEPLATAIDRTTDLWLKDQLLSALTAIVRRERLTRRHAVVKRLLAKHPALADALAPRQ